MSKQRDMAMTINKEQVIFEVEDTAEYTGIYLWCINDGLKAGD